MLTVGTLSGAGVAAGAGVDAGFAGAAAAAVRLASVVQLARQMNGIKSRVRRMSESFAVCTRWVGGVTGFWYRARRRVLPDLGLLFNRGRRRSILRITTSERGN